MKYGYRIISIEANIISKYDNDLIINILEPKDRSRYFTNIFEWSLDSDKLDSLLNKETKEEKSKILYRDEYNIRYSLALVQVEFTKNENEYEGDQKKGVKKDTKNLRKDIYQTGFYINGNHYVRYKRSAGSSREGNCLFILEKYYASMSRWSNAKLVFDDKNPKHDLASWEAYRALSLSSIVATINIPLSGILFLKDQFCDIHEDAILVKKNGETLFVEEGRSNTKNNIWDGESLLDESIFINNVNEKDVDISNKSMLLLRNRFFKTCAFRTKLQKYFKDKGIEDIQTLLNLSHGFTLAKDIKDIVMVVTESSLKYCKFYPNGFSEDCVSAWANVVDSQFGVVKWDKNTMFMGGDLVQTSYQLLNTINLDKEDVEKLLCSSKKYISDLRSDIDILIYNIAEMHKGEKTPERKIDNLKDLDSREKIIMRLLSINQDFYNTKWCKDFINKVVQESKAKLKEGNVLLHGTNATLFGNGPELLKACSGEYDGTSALKKGEISCLKFNDNEELCGARSPHITMGNILLSRNKTSYELSEYFVLSQNIVCVNAINENIQQKLNGCDYDSDTMLLTNDEVIIKTVKNQYDKFKVPVYEPGSSPKTLKREVYELDYIICNNYIGQIVNLSQKLNSLFWETEDILKKKYIYQDICKLAVLSGLEIDRAKRDSGLDSQKIMRDIREKYEEEIKQYPTFFKYTQKESKKQKEERVREYRTYLCPMERILNSAESIDFRYGKVKKHNTVMLSSLFEELSRVRKSDVSKGDAILEELEKSFKKIQALRMKIKDENTSESYKKILLEDIKCLKIDLYNKFLIAWKSEGFNTLMLKKLDEGLKDISELLIEMLFQKENKKIYDKLILNSDNLILMKSQDGDISLYDYLFKKVKK